MKCITVYPIIKKTFSETLTYWVNEDVDVGSIIEVPLQTRKIWAVVDSVLSVYEAKEFIKSQDFKIRKIEKIKKLELFSLNFVFSVLKTSTYYIKPFGEVFSELIPKKILENLTNDIEIQKDDSKEIHIFPIKEYLNAHSDIENKILPIDLYKIDNESIKKVYIHYAESEYYRHLLKKFDYRFFIREFCDRNKIKLIEIESELDLKNKNLYLIEQNYSNKTKIKKKTEDEVVYKDKLHIISPELFSALKKMEKNKEIVFLYTLKKGFASRIVCPDCHHVMRCEVCHENLEIEAKGNSFVYKCPNDHRAVKIDTPCPICQNENLLSLGASIEVVYKEIAKEFDIPVIKIDNDNNTKVEVKKEIAEALENKKGAIFIGNDYLVNQAIGLDFKFDSTGIISLESLFSIPLHDMEYEIYKKIALISNITKKNLLIQTRNLDNPFWEYLKKNDIKKIKNEEELKELNLPPHTAHIQISIPTEKSRRSLEQIKSYLNDNVTYYEVNEKIKTTIHILMSKKEYSKNPIINYLSSLPYYMKVEVDSRNLL